MNDPNDKLALLVEVDALRNRIKAATDLIERCGWIDGDPHKQWLLDQVLRALLKDGYPAWVEAYPKPSMRKGRPLSWEVGIPP